MDDYEFQRNITSDAGEWTYNMRREMQEILPRLFLGPYAAAMKSKLESLKAAGITHIICVTQPMEASIIKPNFPNHFTYLVLNIADNVNQNIIQYLPQVTEFITSCFRQGGKVLIHGNAGISRSASLVIGYVMETCNLPYKDAFFHVHSRRFCISPNEGFAFQLQEYEPIYRARQLYKNGENVFETVSLKRKDRDEDAPQDRDEEEALEDRNMEV